ncbi:MAG: hypothetical protein DRO06_00695 [Thermoproteota archaeon]|nr:MAG: hypothetical protein DRO06_00695 [Candidatus Korarchaeota archaeon]
MWFARKRLRDKVFETLEELGDLSEDLASALLEQVRAYVRGDMEEVAEESRRVVELERRVDSLIGDMSRCLMEGGSVGFLAQDVFSLADAVDHVANRVEVISRMMVSCPASIPEDLGRLLVTLAEKVSSAVRSMAECLEELSEDFEEALEKAEEVERLRDEAVEIEFEFIAEIHTRGEVSPKDYVVLRDIAALLTRVAAAADAAADTVETMAIRYVS